MAYNLQPLIAILEKILDPQQTCSIHDDNKPQLKSLLEKAIFLQQQILEKHSLPNKEINLEKQIRDIIESRMADRMLSASSTEELLISFSSADLQQVTQELDSAMEQVMKLAEVEAGKKMMSSRGTSSSRARGASLNPMVGFDEDLKLLKDRLVGMESKLEIIPIVGMGGVGKTTLARNLYGNPEIVSRFQYARAWATVSQDYDMQSILLSLLRCLLEKDQLDELIDRKVKADELKDVLYKHLFGRRYMIVLDDVWSTIFWDEMRMFFPDNNNGSRIVITTRESNVAAKYGNFHEVQLQSESTSWNLLRQIVFGEDDCPLELESIGRKIASDCGGLPLAITVIGGLLFKVERSNDVWENIGENVRSAIAKSEKGEQYSKIMSLSYNQLPDYLKPCFLYMGAFPEDYEIKGSRLICLWIAEGFVKPNGSNKSLEEEGEEYLKGLVERNLVMVRRSKSNRKAMSYIIHDLLRDLCIRKAGEDNFQHVIGRSISSISNLLRVLDIRRTYFKDFPKEILQLINLRYLGIKCKSLPVGISRLVNLQTLIASLVEGPVPSEIWKMSGLRHLKLEFGSIFRRPKRFALRHRKSGVVFWKAGDGINYKKLVQMNEMQTISPYLMLTDSLLKRGFLKTIPNIKNLGVSCQGHLEIDFTQFHKLETLRYSSLSNGCRFPSTLRKLTLFRCIVNMRMASTLCGLPNLEVLKIIKTRFEIDGTKASEWEVGEEEEFRSLQFLQLCDLKLARWRADETNFPKLRRLLVEYCPRLEEVPSGIGEILTLELIEMRECSPSSVESAKQIVEVQQCDYDNYALQLRIHTNNDA